MRGTLLTALVVLVVGGFVISFIPGSAYQSVWSTLTQGEYPGLSGLGHWVWAIPVLVLLIPAMVIEKGNGNASGLFWFIVGLWFIIWALPRIVEYSWNGVEIPNPIAGKSSSSYHSKQPGCGTRPFGKDFIVSETPSLARLAGNTFYNVDVPDDRVSDFRIVFADSPVPGQPRIKLRNVQDFVTVVIAGESTPLAAGMSRGIVRIRTDTEQNRVAYGRAHNSYGCLQYLVYLERR